MSIANRIKLLESDLELIENRIKLIEEKVKLQDKKMAACAQNKLTTEKPSDETIM